MNFIVAVDKNYAIGYQGGLIYNIPSDLKYFKQVTSEKVVVMGRNTYLSLPKRPLSNRINIVLCDTGENFDGAITCKNLDELFSTLHNYPTDNIFVIGGGSVYNLLMPYCKYAYITKIYAKHDADTFINNVEKQKNWKLIKESQMMEENNLKFQFCLFENQNIQTYNPDLNV